MSMGSPQSEKTRGGGLGDGATEISNAGVLVYGEDGWRLMCWPHTYRRIEENLRSIKAQDKKTAADILSDIKLLQWSVQTDLQHEVFQEMYDLLEQKWINRGDDILSRLIDQFFTYMREQWVESHASNWWEGSHPWNVQHNGGLEACNGDIKRSHTFRKRLPVPKLFQKMETMLREWSLVDDSLLFSTSRLKVLELEGNLPMRTEGFEWLQKTDKPGHILKMAPGRHILRVGTVGPSQVSLDCFKLSI